MSFGSRNSNAAGGSIALGQSPPPGSKRTRVRLVLEYAPDWIVTIVLVGVTAYLTNKGGFKREFSLTDTSIQHTFAVKERISFSLDIILAGVVPLAIQLVLGAVWKKSFWDCHNSTLGLILSLGLATTITNLIKITVGRPRPDLIDRCQPLADVVNGIPFGLVNSSICTVGGHILDDGFKSFPSGHASFSWSGLGFLGLYLAGKLHLFDKRGHAIKAWIALIPPMGAALIAISRTMDYRHHATDVIAGSLLGFLMAILSYHLYFPSLYSPQAHLPFCPPAPVKLDDVLPTTRYETPPVELEDGTAPRPSALGALSPGWSDRRGYDAVSEGHSSSST